MYYKRKYGGLSGPPVSNIFWKPNLADFILPQKGSKPDLSGVELDSPADLCASFHFRITACNQMRGLSLGFAQCWERPSHIFLKIHLFLFMYVSTCLCKLGTTCTQPSTEARRGRCIPWTWSQSRLWTDHYGCWKPNLGPLCEQQISLATELSLQPHFTTFLKLHLEIMASDKMGRTPQLPLCQGRGIKAGRASHTWASHT